MSEISKRLDLPLPGATSDDKRLLDIQAVKGFLEGVDSAFGLPNGFATLDSSGLLHESQIPSIVLTGSTNFTGMPWDFTGSTFGVPVASQVDFRFTAARAFVIPANFAGSIAGSIVNSTDTAVFNIQKNGVTVATITFAAGSNIGVFSDQVDIPYETGDKFQIVSPSVPDATLADIDFTIVSTLVSV